MASSSCLSLCFVAFAILVISNCSPAASAEEFKVGDAQGWRQPAVNHTFMYNLWASRLRFHVGDTLRFEYKNDSVLVVDKWGYYHCNSSSPIFVFNNGNTSITLDQPGPAYFISGDPDHCKEGQKLLIEVLPLHPPSPPPTASPPEPDSEMPPAPSPLANSGAKISGKAGSALMVPALATLVAAALVA